MRAVVICDAVKIMTFLRKIFVVSAWMTLPLVIFLSYSMLKYVGNYENEAPPRRVKQFSQIVAEGVSIKDYSQPKYERVRFRSCRIEKIKRGPFTFGAFNELVFDDVIINFPVLTNRTSEGVSPKGDVTKHLGLPDTIPGVDNRGFSGLRINGLILNKCTSNGLSHVLSAKKAEYGIGKTLQLRDCWLILEQGSNYHKRAELMYVAPNIKIQYEQRGQKVQKDIF